MKKEFVFIDVPLTEQASIQENRLKSTQLSVLSYNILAEHLSKYMWYPYAKKDFLKFSRRKHKIIK